MKYTLETYFLLFMIYSILGWVMESVKMIFNKQIKHFVNRGFLTGPYLPIYGTGVVAISLILGKYQDDIPALFWLSMITCGFIEYSTSYVMEKLFNARWWDYSARKFNINGRICLETLIPFGIAGVITVCFTNPFFVNLLSKIPPFLLHGISIFLLLAITTDVGVCTYLLINLKSTEVDLSADDDTEALGNYLQEKTEEMSMQFESDIRRNRRKRRIKRQRKILHMRLRINKRLSYEYSETIRRTTEFKEKLSNDLKKTKQTNANFTKELKEKFSKKSFLHKRLMDAFPGFEVKEKIKKQSNKNTD